MPRPQRIFIGLTEIAGYFGGLREGFESLGHDVVQINDSGDRYEYGVRSGNKTLTAITDRFRRDEMGPQGRRHRLAWASQKSLQVARLPERLVWLERALRTSDVFVFGGANSFVGGHDLRLIRRAGKRIVWVFTGSDHRPPYLNGKLVRENAHNPDRLVAWTASTRTRVQRIERFAHAVVAHSPSAQLHARPFAEFLSVGAPVRSLPASKTRRAVDGWPGPPGVRILHSPTDPAKGSALIREAIGRLRESGLDISYVELAGRPNAEVRARISQADIVVDEVYSDSPMGLFATEAATSGVPTIVSGYWAPDVASHFPAAAIPPSAFVHPDELDGAIERLATDRLARESLGQRAHEFVDMRWRPEHVAKRVLDLANGDSSSIQIRKPADLTYCAGWGMPLEVQRRAVRSIIETTGADALGLAHNPRLEARVVACADDAVEQQP